MRGIAHEGHRAYKRGDYAKACRRFQEAADQGDAWAQSWLGFMYWKGLGVERRGGLSLVPEGGRPGLRLGAATAWQHV